MKRLRNIIFCCLIYFLVSTESVRSQQCGSNQFTCANGDSCIPNSWKCDGAADCFDKSDEANCEYAPTNCTGGEFRCTNGRCIMDRWLCDGEKDCADNSDEDQTMCENRKCQENHFSCGNGVCIPASWKCDGQNDCPQGDDETPEQCPSSSCGPDEFRCAVSDKCITSRWKCDGDQDCGENDASDEENCAPTTCASNEFKCSSSDAKSQKCIPQRWVCDGDVDCENDEQNCTSTGPSQSQCSNTEFTCANGECIHKTWRCDGYADCADESDEGPTCPGITCAPDHFACKSSGYCRPLSMRCNGQVECPDGSDEERCIMECTQEQFKCNDGKCIANDKVCDGTHDCFSGEDEEHSMCMNKINECDTNNGGCMHLCINTAASYYCKCHEGYTISALNNKTCEDIDECSIPGMCSHDCTNHKGSYRCDCHEGYNWDLRQRMCKATNAPVSIMFSNRHDIRLLTPVTGKYTQLVSNLTSAIAIDFDYSKGTVFWTDVSEEKIYMATVSGDKATQTRTELFGTAMTVKTPDGLAYDWIHKNLYWTDTGKNTIEVGNIETKWRTTLFKSALDEPRAIVVDPVNGYMYWTDWGDTPRIEKAGMNGQDRFFKLDSQGNKKFGLVSSPDVLWPNGLTIDYVSKRLFWVDAKMHCIGSVDLEGRNARQVLMSLEKLKHPFSITVFEDIVYWADWDTEGIHAANKFTGHNTTDVAISLYSPMDVHVYHPYRQPAGRNVCGQNNGGCSHLCLPSNNNNMPTCHCMDGYKLKSDGKTCDTSGISINSTTVSSNITTEASRNGSSTPSINGSGRFKSTSSSTQAVVTPPTTTSSSSSILETTVAEVVQKQTEENVGQIAGIVIGIVGALFIIGGLLGYIIYRQFMRKNIRSMNFDNPVYRKTTDDQFSIEKSQYQPNQNVPASLQPLTGGDQGTNEFV